MRSKIIHQKIKLIKSNEYCWYLINSHPSRSDRVCFWLHPRNPMPLYLPPSLQAAIRTHQYCQSTQGHHCCCLEVCDHKADVRFPPKWKKNPIVDHQQWEYHAELVLEKCKQCTLLINDVPQFVRFSLLLYHHHRKLAFLPTNMFISIFLPRS